MKHLYIIIMVLMLSPLLVQGALETGYMVQQGRSLIDQLDQNITINNVNTSHAFILPPFYYATGQVDTPAESGTGAQTDHDYGDYSVQLNNATSINVIREATDLDIYMTWQVLEALDHEFLAYRGTYDATNAGNDFYIPIGASITAANSMALITGQHNNRAQRDWYERFLFTAYPYNSTHIRVQRSIGTASDVQISWALVDWNTSKIDSIQTGEDIVTGWHNESYRLNITLGQTINSSHSILIFQINLSDGGLDQVAVAGNIYNNTMLQFYPSSVGTTGDVTVSRTIRWYVIDFGNKVGFQDKGQVDYSGNANWYNHTVSLTQDVATNRTIGFASLTHDGAGTAHPRPFPNVFLRDNNSLEIFRSRFGQESFIEWQVLELPYYYDNFPPNISLAKPIIGFFNDTWDPAGVIFNCSAQDDSNGVANITLFLTNYMNLSLIENETCTIGAFNGSCEWQMTLPKGNYTFACGATDGVGNFNMSLNRSFVLNYSDTVSPIFTQQPKNKTHEFGDDFIYKINATDNFQFSHFTVNDSNFTINSSGHLRNYSLVAVGAYHLNVTAIDAYGNTNSTYFNVNVTDTTPPTIIEILNTTEQLGVPLVRELLAFDLSGIYNWSVNNTVNFTINNTGWLFNNSHLAEGVYWLNVTINDTYNNSIWAEFKVNITNDPDLTLPWFDPIPVDQFSEFGDPFSYDVDAVDDYAIDSYWLNDTNFTIDGYGLIENATYVQVGVYSVNITVNDTSNNINWTITEINVSDTTPPTIIDIHNITMPFNWTLVADFNATDLSPITSWSVNDSDFSIDNTGLLENATLLSFGVHWLNISVNDTYDNMVWQEIWVNITDTLPPWFHPISDKTVEYGASFAYDMNASDDVLFDSWRVNDSRFIIDNTGFLENLTLLAVGLYRINITINDSSSNENWIVLNVTVQDTTPPSITVYNQTIEFYSDSEGNFLASDLSPLKTWQVNDSEFTIIDGFLTNKNPLSEGIIWVNVSINDTYDNIIWEEVFVNVTSYTGRYGWYVQHNETRMQGANTIVDIDPVRTDHAFIVVYPSAPGAYDDPNRAGIWAEFVNETRFVLHQGAGAANSNYVGWQVIENPNLRVQQYNYSYSTSTTRYNYTIDKTVNPSDTMVISGWATSTVGFNTAFPQVLWSANMSNQTSVQLIRDTNGSVGKVGFQVVEFNDGSTVQQGSLTFAGGSANMVVSPVDLSESWIYVNHAGNGSSDGLDDIGINAINVDDTTWQAFRWSAGGYKRVFYYVISTPGARVQRGSIQGNPLAATYYPTGGFTSVAPNRSILMNSWFNSGNGNTFSNYLTSFHLHNSTHFHMTRNGTGNVHNVSWQVIELPEYSVSWNQTTLDLGLTHLHEANLSGIVDIQSNGIHDDITVTCLGNCSVIEHNFTDGISLGYNDNVTINFTCNNTYYGNHSALFSVTSFQDGSAHTINITCNITRDDTPPVVNINTSINNTFFSVNQPSISFNFTDNHFMTANCTLFYNHTPYNTTDGLMNDTQHSLLTNASLADNNYSVYINCTDPQNNTGQSDILYITIDTTPPDVFNVTPSPGKYYNRSRPVNITANVTDNYAVFRVFANITWMSGSAWQEMTSPGSDVYDTEFLNTATLGRYNVTIYANDTVNWTNITEETYFLVTMPPDIWQPNVSINTSQNNTLTANTAPSIGFNFTDNMSATANCTFYFNASAYNTTNDLTNNTNYLLTVNDTLNDGNYTVYVNCSDNASNVGMSEHIFYRIDTTAPYVNITEPEPGLWIYLTNQTNISANVSDVGGVFGVYANISWIGGNEWHQLTDIDGDGVYTTTFLNTNTVSRYNVTVYANDTLGHVNSTETTWFNVTLPPDIIPPLVYINQSQNNTVTDDPMFGIGFNFTDNRSASANCSLVFDGLVVNYSSFSNNTPSVIYPTTAQPDNNYSVYVNCSDEFNNTGKSATIFVRIDATPPDVTAVSATGIMVVREDINISASVTDYRVDKVYANISNGGAWDYLEMTDSNGDDTYDVMYYDTFDLGLYNVRIYANDSLGNMNSTETTSFFLITNSSVNMTAGKPDNQTGDNDGLVLFKFNVTAKYNVSSCTLFINDTPSFTNNSVNQSIEQTVLLVLEAGLYEWYVNCSDEYGVSNVSSTKYVSVIPTSLFTTIDFSTVNVGAIENLSLSNAYGSINFTGFTNLSKGPNLDVHVSIQENHVSVDSENVPQLNKTAIITIENLEFLKTPVILRDDQACPSSICRFISYSSQRVIFNVTEFSAYSASANSQLIVFDDSDFDQKHPGEIITFYANYTNITSGQPISGSCNFSLNGTFYPMAYADGLYTYTYNFSYYGSYEWNVSCSSPDYEPLNATDNATILRPTGVKHGYCTIEYLVQGRNFKEGYIHPGDKVRLYCEPGYEISESERFSVKLIPGKGIPTEKHAKAPEHMTRNVEVVYP